MKLKVLQDKFSKAVNLASRFTSNRAQLPVLANLLLSAEKNSLRILSTNLEVSVSVSVGAQVESEGKVTVPARTIADIVSNLPNDTIELTSQKEKLLIKSQSFSSELLGMNAGDFPDIPLSVGRGGVKLSSDIVQSSLAKTLFSVSIDETRPVLTGVYLIVKKGSISFVSTDGFRLSVVKNNIKTDINQEVIIPKNVLNELLRLSKEEDEIAYAFKKKESQVIFEIGDTVLSSRVIEGEFPNFKNIIPKDCKIRVFTDKEELLRVVKLASVFARDSSNIIKFSLSKDFLKVKAESESSGKQEGKLDVKVEKGNVKGFEIAFNFRFLEEFINSVEGEEIVMEFTDSKSPGVFKDPEDKNYLHLIMPVKIQE